MNIGTKLGLGANNQTTGVNQIYRFCRNVLYLFQNSIQDPALHLAVMPPQPPRVCDSSHSFLVFHDLNIFKED